MNIGKKFNALTVLSVAPRTRGKRMVVAQCDCGKVVTIRESKLRIQESCGCKRNHGHSAEPQYKVWKQMIQRCTNPNFRQFADYGGRGIAVCARWRQSYVNFLEDMGPRPPGTTIDRINVDGDYEPGNCRWATRTEQALNTTRNVIVDVGGHRVPLKMAAEMTGLRYGTLRARLKRGWDPARAVTAITKSSRIPGHAYSRRVDTICSATYPPPQDR